MYNTKWKYKKKNYHKNYTAIFSKGSLIFFLQLHYHNSQIRFKEKLDIFYQFLHYMYNTKWKYKKKNYHKNYTAIFSKESLIFFFQLHYHNSKI